MKKNKEFNAYLEEQLKDLGFRKEYEAQQPEREIIRAFTEARASRNITQKELADKVGESGRY